MARVPIDQRPPLAQWLIRARASQDGTPGATGKDDAYTVENLRRDMRAAGFKAPDRSTYAGWESGATTPNAASVKALAAFWALRKIAGPEASVPDPAPAPDLATALLALARELAEARQEREDYRRRLGDLEAMCAELVARSSLPGGGPAGAPTGGALPQTTG